MRNKHAHILLVEDDTVDVENTIRAFKAQGIENPITVATNGRMAMDMLKGNGRPKLTPTPQLLLLDLNLPEMGGIAFLKELRQDPELRSCSVFVITAHGSEKDILEAYDLNVAGYILKPLQYQSFQEAIETLHSYWDLIELPN